MPAPISRLGYRLHPALTDLPIGFWTSAWLLDIVGGRHSQRSARTLAGWGVVSAVPTIAAGITDARHLPADARRVAAVHATVNIAATAGFALSWQLRRRGRQRAGVAAGWGASALATVGGYLGGRLAFGPQEHSVNKSSEPADDDGAELGDAVSRCLGGRTVATAESCTAGRVASAIAAGGDASEFFRGSLVSYQETTKREHLGVTAESVYSEQAAAEMALGVCRLLDADAAVATSGVVGDEPQDGAPPGTVFIATAVDGETDSHEYHFDGSPGEVCLLARDQALRDLAAALTRAGSRL